MRSTFARNQISSLSAEDYSREYWPHIREMLEKLISLNPSNHFSGEELSRLIYVVCWNQHHQLLLNDLILFVRERLKGEAQRLGRVEGDQALLSATLAALEEHRGVCHCLANAFSHLDRSYITSQCPSVLQDLLFPLFAAEVLSARPLFTRLATAILHRFRAEPPAEPREQMNGLLSEMARLSEEYSAQFPELVQIILTTAAFPWGHGADSECWGGGRGMAEDDDLDVGVEETLPPWGTPDLGSPHEQDEDQREAAFLEGGLKRPHFHLAGTEGCFTPCKRQK